jgi:hypothetical protein
MARICATHLLVLQYGLFAVKQRFKSVFFAVIACLVASGPAAASHVTYYPATPGFEPPSAFYDFDFSAFPLGTATGFSETVGSFTITYTAPNDPFAFRTVDSGDIPATSSPPQWLLGETGSSVLEVSFNHRVFGVGVEFLVFGDTPISMSLLREGSVVDPIVAGPPAS